MIKGWDLTETELDYMINGLDIFVCWGEIGFYDIIAKAHYPDCPSTNAAIETVGTMIANYSEIKEDIQKRRGKRRRKANDILLAIHMLESTGKCLNDSARNEALKLYEGEDFSSNGIGSIEFRKKHIKNSFCKNIIIVLNEQIVDFHAMKQVNLCPVNWMVDKIDPDEFEGEDKKIMEVFKEGWKNYDGYDPDKYKGMEFHIAAGDWLPGLSESLSEEEIEHGWTLVKEEWLKSLQKINANGLYTVQNIPFSQWTKFAEDISKLDDYPYFEIDECLILDYYREEKATKRKRLYSD